CALHEYGYGLDSW
nr:immunoglobulin heavy chain junction region [Macaca mulatta]MOV86599.1 immunoglobulin heavy chain junction region [Macaca mulatta]MOV87061.1 immunoglobulin heavy chain junction region [Macaca mulatta]MOV87163.1 immunoglobulin heavy chain junction region [Macaca mulatta]MOV87382.1 immunoglobulin heavy chain junction region [Macaca mulatta]